MKGTALAVAALASVTVLGACGASATGTSSPTLASAPPDANQSSQPPPAPPLTISAASAAATTACPLSEGADLLVRYVYSDGEIDTLRLGSVDLVRCESTVQSIGQQESAIAAQGTSECVTIAEASSDPGYDVNAATPAPLTGVIATYGSGC